MCVRILGGQSAREAGKEKVEVESLGYEKREELTSPASFLSQIS